MSVGLGDRCAALDVYARRERAAAPPRSRTGPISTWARWGAHAGWWLGAVVGGGAFLVGGDWPAAPIGILAGGGLGAVAGLVVGVLDGAVITVLSATVVLSSTPDRVRDRTAVVAFLTTAVTGTALLFGAFGWLPGRGARFLLIVLPAGAGAFMAAALSRRMPPVSRRVA
jgi:hypothetical protein